MQKRGWIFIMNEQKMKVNLMNRNLNVLVDYSFEMPYYMEKIFEHLKGKDFPVFDYCVDDSEKHKQIGHVGSFEFDGDKITGVLVFKRKRVKKYIDEIKKNNRLFSFFEGSIIKKENGILEVIDIKNFNSYVFGNLQEIEKISF